MFYDLLCPYSEQAHYTWKTLLPQESHIDGKTYGDLVSMRVTPFVLPYHIHSYQITSVVPMLMDLCEADSSKCYVDQYAELCWKDLETILGDKTTSE